MRHFRIPYLEYSSTYLILWLVTYECALTPRSGVSARGTEAGAVRSLGCGTVRQRSAFSRLLHRQSQTV